MINHEMDGQEQEYSAYQQTINANAGYTPHTYGSHFRRSEEVYRSVDPMQPRESITSVRQTNKI